MQGSLGGLAEAAAGEHEIVAFAPTSIRGPSRIRAALAGIDVEVRTWPLPFSHAVRTAWSGLGPPGGGATARRVRRPSLLGLDVPAPARGRARDDDPRPRAASPSRVDDRQNEVDARSQVRGTPPTTCDVVFVNSAYTGRDVTRDARRPERADSRRASRAEGRLPRGRAGRRSRCPVRPHRRDARAAEESAGARRGAPAAGRRARSWPSSARKAGASSRCSTPRASAGSGTSRTMSSLASTAARPSSRIRPASRASAFR